MEQKPSLHPVGQNLLQDREEEYIDSTGSAGTVAIKRCAGAKFSWQF